MRGLMMDRPLLISSLIAVIGARHPKRDELALRESFGGYRLPTG